MDCDICHHLQFLGRTIDHKGNFILFAELLQSAQEGCRFCQIILTGFERILDISRTDLSEHLASIHISGLFSHHRGLTIHGTTTASKPVSVEFYTNQKLPFPWNSLRSAIDISPVLDHNSTLRFIKLCSAESGEIRFEKALPTRIPDLDSKPRNPKNELLVSLKENGRSERGVYMTLSHCWGSKGFIATTKGTYTQRQAGIRLSELPQSFKDAIAITRGLNIRYLWIDSLCIVQDDARDWEIKSSKIANVFSNSWLNIVISHSAGCENGCFVERSVTVTGTTQKLKSHRICGTEQLPYEILVRPDFKMSHWELSRPMQFYDSMRFGAPLLSRAWVFQERRLAPRTIYFKSSETVWECDNGFRCECGLLDQWTSRASLRKLLLEGNKPSFEQLELAWRQVVENYSVLDLTYAEDRLPALSGIASLFGSHLRFEYLAGLWRIFLPHHLLWVVKVSPKASHRNFRVARAQPYRAPTWSWISLDTIDISTGRSEFSTGSILCRNLIEARDDLEEAQLRTAYDRRFKILHAECEVLGHNPYGRVSAGQLIVQAAYIVPTGVIQYVGHYGADENCHLTFAGIDLKVPLASDILPSTDTSADEFLPAAKDLICLFICPFSESMTSRNRLVLMPSRSELRKFERMGAMFALKKVDLFKDAKEDVFEII